MKTHKKNKIKTKIHKLFAYIVVFLFFLGLLPVGINGLVVTPDISYVVGNETYSVTHNMTFSQVVITGSDYITFNSTEFKVDSGNSIDINLSYLSSNIGGASVGDEVLDFVVNCSSGLVYFNLSGFKTNTLYNVSRNGSSIATPTSDGSGILRFTNDVWSYKHFEIIEDTNIGAPNVSTNATTLVEETTATLHGYLVDDGNESCNLWFEYGVNTSYGTNLTDINITSGFLNLLDSQDDGGDYINVWGDNSYVYTACGYDGVRAYTFNGTAFTLKATQDDGNKYLGVWGDGTYIYTVCYTSGIRAYTFDGTSFTLKDTHDAGGYYYDVWGDGTYIYVANYDNGIRAYTFNENATEEFWLKDTIDNGGTYYDVWGNGTYIYTACGSDGIRAYTFDGTVFTLKDTIDNGGTYYGVWGNSTYIYTACNDDGIRAYTFDGTVFTLKDTQDDDGLYFDVWGDDGYIYTACYYNGIYVYTFDGSSFTLEYSRDDGGKYYSVWGDNNYVYPVCYASGIRAYNPPCRTGTEFYFNLTGLSPGQLYRCRAVANNSNGTDYGNDKAFLTKPLWPTVFNTTSDIGKINLSWTKGTGANLTYIERNTTSSWERGNGTLVYNGSALYYLDIGLGNEVTYYYRAWSYTNWTYNPTVHQFSDNNGASSNTTVSLDPPYNASVNYNVTNNNLTFSWSRGNYSYQEVVVKNNNSFPTTPSDGIVVQNCTNTSYNETISSYAYFTVWSYNVSNNLYSNTGLDINWGNLGLNCFNESKPSQAIGFDIEITNSDASVVFTATDLTNTHWIDLNEIPFGDNTVFIVSNSSYKLRTYYKDLEANHFYNFSFYLPPISTDDGSGGGGTGTGTLRTYTDVKTVTDPNSDVTVTLTHTLEEMIGVYVYNISGVYGEWVSVPNDNYTVSGDDVIINRSVLSVNTTMVKVTYYYLDYDNTVDTQLYILNVVGPQNEYTSLPVEGAKIIIKRYINTSDSYEEIASLLTDANGNADVYLIPETVLKVFISKDGYDSAVSTYIPSASIPTKTFRIVPSVTLPDDYDIFWDDITFTGTMYKNATIHVVYFDSNSSTVDTQIYLYDVYDGGFTLVDTNIKFGNNDFSYWVNGINTTRDYELYLYFNNTANYASVTSPVVITVVAVNISWGDRTPVDLEGRFENMFSSFPLGYENVIAIAMSIIILCIVGNYNVGFGIISAGASLGFMQALFALIPVSNAFNAWLAFLCPVIIAIGILYAMSVKGEEHI